MIEKSDVAGAANPMGSREPPLTLLISQVTGIRMRKVAAML